MFDVAGYAASQAWIRAKRSALISAATWRRLLEEDSLERLVTTARTTRYGERVSADVGRTERQLARTLAEEMLDLARFVPGRAARGLLVWHARRPELDNLKTVLRTLHFRQPRERAVALLLPLPRSSLDWRSLLSAGDVASLVEQLRGSVYATPLEDALERYREEGSLFFLEVSLDLAYLGQLVRRIGQLAAADRRQAETFLGYAVDVQNLTWAYRYRIYAHLSPEEILNYTLHRGFRVDVRTLRRVVTGSPLSEEAGRLGVVVPEDLPEREALERVEIESRRLLFARAGESFRGLTFHLGAALAYATLLESEIDDLVTLFEGRSEGMTTEALAARLVRGVDRVRA